MLCRVVCTHLKTQKEKQAPPFTLCIFHRQKQYCLSSITADDKGRLYYSNDSGTLFCVTLAKDIPATSTPTVTNIPAATNTPTVSNSPAPAAKKSVSKPKKPYSVKVKKKQEKIQSHLEKKAKNTRQLSPTDMVRENGKKENNQKKYGSNDKKGKKRLQIRLRCKIKNSPNGFTPLIRKPFHFVPNMLR